MHEIDLLPLLTCAVHKIGNGKTVGNVGKEKRKNKKISFSRHPSLLILGYTSAKLHTYLVDLAIGDTFSNP